LYDDELEDFLKRNEYLDIFNGKSYFVRCENVSLKYGEHREGPYYNMKQIIESVCSCIEGHKPLYENTTELIFYLFDWINLQKHNEFRVFVHNNKITAISQQHLYGLYEKDIEENLENKLQLIVDYFDSTIKQNMKELGFESYCYDFVIVFDNLTCQMIPYFIEPNSFGKEYAAGSALFHWIEDENILYGKNDKICFRYTVDV
jgi:hypothetical protein